MELKFALQWGRLVRWVIGGKVLTAQLNDLSSISERYTAEEN